MLEAWRGGSARAVPGAGPPSSGDTRAPEATLRLSQGREQRGAVSSLGVPDWCRQRGPFPRNLLRSHLVGRVATVCPPQWPPAGVIWGPEQRDPAEAPEAEADITQALLARRKRFEMNTDASLKIINENIEHIRKIQQEQRQNLHYKYSQQFLPLFQQWDIEVQKAEEQEEKLANMFQEQRKLFLQSRIIQREKVKEIKNLYEQLLKSIKDLEEYHESLVIGEQSKVKKEMAELQEKILRETQQQEVAVVEKSLHSLLY
uniref:synaptonemal complex protein 3-like n=1 Tax=Urocitellus parryii TaxID=9999 RepID=UPI000E55F36F|nr:synaptonemal complex protein 3-like [Urocitellus parryii]